MQIVIDIPDGYLGIIMSNIRIEGSIMDKRIRQAIRNGKVLPKGHGDLIDRTELKNVINKFECYDQVLDAPTIIEADKAESEDE